MLDDGAERENREEGQCPDDDHCPDDQRTNRGPWVGNVPAEDGTFRLLRRLPAAASRGTMIRNRPISIARPIVTLYQGVLAFRPAKALPLFPVPLE